MQKRKLPPLRHAARRPPPAPAEPLPPPPEPDSTLGQHHANLKSLGTELAALEHLNDLWSQLAAQLEKEEAAAESTVKQILVGAATDAKLSEKSVRIASLGAQIATLRKRANVSLAGAHLQNMTAWHRQRKESDPVQRLRPFRFYALRRRSHGDRLAQKE